MRKYLVITVLLFAVVVFTACTTPGYEIASEYEFANIDQLSSAATDIVRVSVLERSNDDTPEIIRLFVDGVYKGNYKHGDIIELRHPFDDYDIFLEYERFLLFLNSIEGEPAELLNPYQSVYHLDRNLIIDEDLPYIFKNLINSDGFYISYQDLLAIWVDHIQSLFAEYAPLDFVIAGRGRINSGRLHENPVVITSMGDLAKHLEDGNDNVRWIAGSTASLSEYTEEFFAESFLLILDFVHFHSGISYRIDAIFENGDIYVSRRTYRVVAAMVVEYWRTIIEVDNRIIPEQFNLIINDRWF